MGNDPNVAPARHLCDVRSRGTMRQHVDGSVDGTVGNEDDRHGGERARDLSDQQVGRDFRPGTAS
jgi:hypothetical protein